MSRKGEGPIPAQIMLIGEYFSEDDQDRGAPFQGYTGVALNQMLDSAGIMRSECYCTNVINARPPHDSPSEWVARTKQAVTHAHSTLHDKMVTPTIIEGYQGMLDEISFVNPNIIVAFGDLALWALTGEWGVAKWRGSQLLSLHGRKVIPAYHPRLISGDQSLRSITINDLSRAARERTTREYTNIPKWNFILRPSLNTVLEVFSTLTEQAEKAPIWVDFDLETSPIHITCAGISWSRTDALCIPITSSDNEDGYWSPEEEAIAVHGLYKLLTNPNVWVRGQNLLYDAQHTYRWWHFIPNVKQDTMIAHHSMFCGMKKSLAFQASMYCDFYRFWKEDHKDLSNKAGA